MDLAILEVAFSVGDLAVASRRKQANVNEEGGVCKITKAYRGRDNVARAKRPASRLMYFQSTQNPNTDKCAPDLQKPKESFQNLA